MVSCAYHNNIGFQDDCFSCDINQSIKLKKLIEEYIKTHSTKLKLDGLGVGNSESILLQSLLDRSKE